MLCANINRNQKRVYSQQFQNQMKEALGSQSLKKKNNNKSVFIRVYGRITQQNLPFLYEAMPIKMKATFSQTSWQC